MQVSAELNAPNFVETFHRTSGARVATDHRHCKVTRVPFSSLLPMHTRIDPCRPPLSSAFSLKNFQSQILNSVLICRSPFTLHLRGVVRASIQDLKIVRFNSSHFSSSFISTLPREILNSPQFLSQSLGCAGQTQNRTSSTRRKMHGLKSGIQFIKYNSCNCHKLFSTLQSSGPMASLLKTRSVIRFKGPETIKYLQGLVTNDVRSLENPEPIAESNITPNMPVVVAPTVYTAMLTPQGRFLFDFFLYRPPRPDEKLDRTGSGPANNSGELEIYADVDGSLVDEILATLKRYRLRSKVEIENMAQDFCCWQQFGGDLEGKPSSVEDSEADSIGYGGTLDRSGVSDSGGNNLGWQWNKDPRLPCLGYRGIFPSNATPPLVKADKEADEGNFRVWRLEKGVAEGSIEIPKGEAIPLEYNLAGLNAISFDKGCYVGQELIARTHHRGVIRKRLIPLRFLNDGGKEMDQKVSPGSEVINTTTQKKVGTVTTAVGCRGLGLIRLDKAFKETGSLTIKGNEDIYVETIRPKWWPSEWFLDEHQQSAAA